MCAPRQLATCTPPDADVWARFTVAQAPTSPRHLSRFGTGRQGSPRRPRPLEVDTELLLFIDTGGEPMVWEPDQEVSIPAALAMQHSSERQRGPAGLGAISWTMHPAGELDRAVECELPSSTGVVDMFGVGHQCYQFGFERQRASEVAVRLPGGLCGAREHNPRPTRQRSGPTYDYVA